MGGGKKNENENGRKREFATDPRSKRAREKIRRSGTPLTPIFFVVKRIFFHETEHLLMKNVFLLRNHL